MIPLFFLSFFSLSTSSITNLRGRNNISHYTLDCYCHLTFTAITFTMSFENFIYFIACIYILGRNIIFNLFQCNEQFDLLNFSFLQLWIGMQIKSMLYESDTKKIYIYKSYWIYTHGWNEWMKRSEQKIKAPLQCTMLYYILPIKYIGKVNDCIKHPKSLCLCAFHFIAFQLVKQQTISHGKLHTPLRFIHHSSHSIFTLHLL